MKEVEIEISARVTFNQTIHVSEEDAEFLKEHEGYSARAYSGHHKDLYMLLDSKLDFDCISEISELSLDIVDIIEEENDSN